MNQWKRSKETQALLKAIDGAQAELFASYIEGDLLQEDLEKNVIAQSKMMGFADGLETIREWIDEMGQNKEEDDD